MNNDLFNSFHFAIKSLNSRKLRTFLAVLAVSIGIAAVIIVMSSGEGLRSLVNSQLESFGSDLIQIEVKVPIQRKNFQAHMSEMSSGISVTTLKDSDRKAILKEISGVENAYSGLMGQEQAVKDENRKKVMIFAVSSSVFEVDNAEIEEGRMYTPDEENSLARVAVLGADIKKTLFGDGDAVGKTIKIKQKLFKVIGTVKKRGTVSFFNFDEIVYLPLNTFQKQIAGIDHVSFISVKGMDGSNLKTTARQIENLLRERHGIAEGAEDDFEVTTMEEAMEMIGTVLSALEILLLAIAGISLAVGGVGIMNIMYVSAKERTFEIGLRKALGAKYGNILSQFLWEALAISFIGALAGIIMGSGIAFGIARLAGSKGFSWAFKIPLISIFISVGFSSLIGTLFGYWPAKSAAQKDPVKSLSGE